MLLLIGIQLVMMLVNMGLQMCFYAGCAYWVAKMARKGWKAGK